MRYKPDHKKEMHERIVQSASREFRAKGFDSVGIAKLMGDLNLTHGGFYAHFPDKEELIAESLTFALNESLETLLMELKTGGFKALIDYYLGEAHRDHPELGCPLPPLASEVARHPDASKASYTKNLIKTFNSIAQYMPGESDNVKYANTTILFSTMVGAVTLARSVSDPDLSKTILESSRTYLLNSFGKTTE